MIKLLISDFDGTLVKRDILDYMCSLNGKYKLSKELNEKFLIGNDIENNSLSSRINLLSGLTIHNIQNVLNRKEFLRKGVEELFEYLNINNIKSIICSGNIIPILDYYANKLKVNVVIGSSVEIKKETIKSFQNEKIKSLGFKKNECCNYIKQFNVNADEIIVLGDSYGDLGIMNLGKYKYFINPKNGVEKMIDCKVISNISELLEDIKIINNN